MKKIINKYVEYVMLYVGLYNILFKTIGFSMILIVSLHGIVVNGLSGFWSLRIGPKGLAVIWLGAIIIILAKKIEKFLSS